MEMAKNMPPKPVPIWHENVETELTQISTVTLIASLAFIKVGQQIIN